ncbi:ATP-binding protein [Streptomyces sp. NPDC017448]|uniref:ATP-binding protein n=1 Tax=Streptomyces sp. NPDC017448 TaxID=3364996 RepID=UPI0037A9F48C
MIDERIDYARRWRRFNLPVQYQGLRLTQSQMTGDNRNALLQTQQLITTWAERYAPTATGERPELLGKGLVLGGNPGTGKTRMACAALTEVHYQTNLSGLFLPVTGYFAATKDQQKFTNLAEKFRNEEALARVLKLQELLDRVMKTPLLVFDDMGKEYSAASGWVGTEIHRILRTRYVHGLPTIITSNLPLEEWKRYDAALFSFLKEAYDLCSIGGKDWRRA